MILPLYVYYYFVRRLSLLLYCMAFIYIIESLKFISMTPFLYLFHCFLSVCLSFSVSLNIYTYTHIERERWRERDKLREIYRIFSYLYTGIYRYVSINVFMQYIRLQYIYINLSTHVYTHMCMHITKEVLRSMLLTGSALCNK